MSSGPTVATNYFTERHGVLAVASAVNQMRLVWRETPNADVGIDGQIEHVSHDGRATGRLVAVQVKSGASYFQRQGSDVSFRPQPKHASYWRQFPIPVLLCLHDPDSNITFWTDARRQLIAPDSTGDIWVSHSAQLGEVSREALFEAYGPSANSPVDAENLAIGLASIRSRSHPALTGLSLFLAGMTDIATKLFFDLSLFFEIGDFFDVELYNSDGLHPFVDQYLAFLFTHSLTRYDYSEYLTDLDRGLQPSFVAPLTSIGLQVRDYAYEYSRKHGIAPKGIVVTEERSLTMVRNGREALRFAAVQRMAEKLLAEPAT